MNEDKLMTEAERAELAEMARAYVAEDPTYSDHAAEHRGIADDIAKLAKGLVWLAKKHGCEDELLAYLNRDD